MKQFLFFLGCIGLMISVAQAKGYANRSFLPSGAEGDFVEVVDISMSPAQPQEGDSVTVKMLFRNVGSQVMKKLDWRIVRGDEVLGIGAVENLPPGRRFYTTVSWIATGGKQGFSGEVDFDRLLGESDSGRQNNIRTVEATIGSRPLSLATAALDAGRAERAGAHYAVRVDDSLGSGCARSGLVLSPGGPAGVTLALRIRCAPPGGRVRLEAFTDFRLQNGWKIKEISEKVTLSEPAARWKWIRRPAVGSSDPSMLIEIETGGAEGEIGIVVLIEGPENREAY